MKKVIAAAAGLMLVGTVASSAIAEVQPGVTFQGDARARFYFQEEYGGPDNSDTHWNQRVRLQWKATSKGGAYAVGRFRLADTTWDGTQLTGARGEGTNLRVDKAFIGVPVGTGAVEAGLMYRSLTPFLYWDVLVDSLQYKGTVGPGTLVAFYHMEDEYEEDEEGNRLESDAVDDNDINAFGVWYNWKFAETWGATVAAVYQDDAQATDNTGFLGTVNLTAGLAMADLEAELAYKEGDLVGSEDDNLGGFIKASFATGVGTYAGVLGFTADGFVADGDFGPFLMLSDYSQIATGNLIGEGGDTTFLALTGDWKVSESFGVGVVGAYADQDDAGDAFEIGGTASYAITDGAKLNGVIGYLDLDEAEESPFGFGLSLEISY